MNRALALFAKAAIPGAVKTRLVPPLTPDAAAALAEAFFHDSLALAKRAARSSAARLVVVYTPATAEQWFRDRIGEDVDLIPQVDGDLTQRLGAAYQTLAARGCTTVCFVGSDSPTLPESSIHAAFSALANGNDVAIGPTDDGGYYLIGLAAAHLAVFEKIAWSTPVVFAQTCAAARRLGLRVERLAPWYDIDDAASLNRLRIDARARYAPHTAQFLMQFDAVKITR